MKRIFCRFAALLCLLTVMLISAGAEEAYLTQTPVFTLPVAGGEVELRTALIEDEYWLFLPSFAEISDLDVQGASLEWQDMEPDVEGVWNVRILQGEQATDVNVMRSENLRALFLFSDDPVSQGRTYIEESPGHDTYTTATMALVNTEGTVDHAKEIIHLRGRGNWTWSWDKRAYQIKLAQKTDLLDTGDNANRARTWVLLAEALDGSLLHNRITADMAKELGLNAMDSEYVDLYYDGEYRGTYLLTEKVEVGEGRIDVLDYDEILEKWNNKVGQFDLEVLPASEAVNRFGNEYHYVEGIVENNRPDSGAYFIEMEAEKVTLSNRCYFFLNGNTWTAYALKSPENASQNMVSYISERLQEAQNTLKAGGVNPDNGRTLEEDFHVDAFARTLLLQELSYNVDGYTYSSSYFVLPDGERRFEPGPVWDFDLAYRYYRDGRNAAAAGFKDTGGWVTDFYSVPSFLHHAREVYASELYPMIQNILLGEQAGEYLQPLEAYQEKLSASAAMNNRLWGMIREGRFHYGDTFAEDVELLRKFLSERSKWLYNALNDLDTADPHRITLWMDVSFTNPDDSLLFRSAPWQKVAAETLSAEQISEATEEEFAVWQAEIRVAATDGRSLEGSTIMLNGVPMTAEAQNDGSLIIRAQYEDLSYRPVDYDGEDVGLIYNYDRYIERYPDVAEACGYDEQAVMAYFFDEGMYEGQVGNGLFDPREIAVLLPHVADYLYDDWMSYYWEFLSWGYDSDWTANSTARFTPEITDAF